MQIKFAVLGAALLLSSAAHAAPAPPIVPLGPAGSSYFINMFGGSGAAFGSGPGSGTVPGGDPGSSADWSIVYGASPALALTMTGGGSGSLFLRYTFAITANSQQAFDDFNAFLLLDPKNGAELNGFYSVDLGDQFEGVDAFATVGIDAGFGQGRFECRTDAGPGPHCTGLTGGVYNQQAYVATAALVADPGNLSFFGQIAMEASIVKLFGGTAHAFIDPLISLPAAYLGGGGNAANFTVSTSPNLNTVPEPASWAMLIAGFGLVGAVQRRRAAALG